MLTIVIPRPSQTYSGISHQTTEDIIPE